MHKSYKKFGLNTPPNGPKQRDSDILLRENYKKFVEKSDNHIKNFKINIEDKEKRISRKNGVNKDKLTMKRIDKEYFYIGKEDISNNPNRHHHRHHHHQNSQQEKNNENESKTRKKRKHRHRSRDIKENEIIREVKQFKDKTGKDSQTLNMKQRFEEEIKHCVDGFKKVIGKAFGDFFTAEEKAESKEKPLNTIKPLVESRSIEEKKKKIRKHRVKRQKELKNYTPQIFPNDAVVAYVNTEFNHRKKKKVSILTKHTLPVIVVEPETPEEWIEKKKKSPRFNKYYKELDPKNCYSDCLKKYDNFSDGENFGNLSDNVTQTSKNPIYYIEDINKEKKKETRFETSSVFDLYNRSNEPSKTKQSVCFSEYKEETSLSKETLPVPDDKKSSDFLTHSCLSSSHETIGDARFSDSSFEYIEINKLMDRDYRINSRIHVMATMESPEQIEKKIAATLEKSSPRSGDNKVTNVEIKQKINKTDPVKPKGSGDSPKLNKEIKQQKKPQSPRSQIPHRIKDHDVYTEKITQITRGGPSRLPVLIRTPKPRSSPRKKPLSPKSSKSDTQLKPKNWKTGLKRSNTMVASSSKKQSATSIESKANKDLSSFEKRKLYGKFLRESIKKKGSQTLIPQSPQSVEIRFFLLENGVLCEKNFLEKKIEFRENPKVDQEIGGTIMDAQGLMSPVSMYNIAADSDTTIPSTLPPSKNNLEITCSSTCTVSDNGAKSCHIDLSLTKILAENFQFLSKDFSSWQSIDSPKSSIKSNPLIDLEQQENVTLQELYHNDCFVIDSDCSNKIPKEKNLKAVTSEESGFATSKTQTSVPNFFKQPQIQALFKPEQPLQPTEKQSVSLIVENDLLLRPLKKKKSKKKLFLKFLTFKCLMLKLKKKIGIIDEKCIS